MHLALTAIRRRLGVPASVTLAPVVGRQLDVDALTELRRIVDGLEPDQPIQVVHVDDVVRLVAAIERGEVDANVTVAAPGTVPVAAVARALGARRPRGTGAAPLVTGSAGGFVPGWTASEAVDDLALAALGTRWRGRRARRIPGRARFWIELPPYDHPPADRHPLGSAAPDGVRGELDSPIDSRFPVYSSVNLSEALPGPATPLSLTTVAEGTRAATVAFIDLVPVGGVLETEALARGQGVLGHRLYVNLSYAFALARITPGMDVDAMVEQFVGRGAAEELTSGPVPGAPGRLRMARVTAAMARRTLGMIRAHADESAAYVAAVDRLRAAAAEPGRLDDERLQVLTGAARDLIVTGWFLGGRNVLAVQAYESAATRLVRAPLGPVGSDETPLASGATLRAVRALAAAARADDAAMTVLQAGGSNLTDRLRAASPVFASRLDEALGAVGHRGPAECELANPTFADDPDLLLRGVARVLDGAEPADPGPPPPQAGTGVRTRLAGLLHRREARAQLLREETRDHLVRVTDVLRRLALEQGRRLAQRGLLAAVDDVFFLTYAELFAPPADAPTVAERRRAERARLAGIRMSPIVSGTWSEGDAVTTLVAGEGLTGLGASPGTAKGRVRIVTPDRVDRLESGEVLVANVTDVGYTFAFAYAAAVVTDVGGAMSHAAVVAREFGIPAIVDTGNATERLQDGMLVAVDGTTGSVTVLEGAEPT